MTDDKAIILLLALARKNLTEEDKQLHNVMRSKFIAYWAGRKYRCNITGAEFTIPPDCKEGDYYNFGHSAIDLGRFNYEKEEPYYSRMMGNPEEIK